MSSDSAYAAAPLDHAKADIILRSSDNVDFRVFKSFLSIVSPVFETLFEVPHPGRASENQEIRDGLAVIPVAEDKKTLDTLLRFCYPCALADDPKLEVVQDTIDILNAARKYSLGAIETKARQVIANPRALAAEPFRCFAIAHRAGLRKETLLAAKHTLTQPLIPPWFKEIELISAANLLSLLTYHQKCGEAVYALRLDLSWITSYYRKAEACKWLSGQSRSSKRNCGCTDGSTSRYKVFDYPGLQWWENFMEEAFVELRDRPCKATVRTLADRTVREVKAKNCDACSPKITKGMHSFALLFEREIEKTVSGITLESNF